MKHRAFTLVELLVVIGIIIILAGVLLPVLIGAGKKADQTKARAEITTLVNAIKQYESTYGILPVPKDWKAGKSKEHSQLDNKAYTWLIKVLQAEELTSTEETDYGALNVVNSRKIKFIDVIGKDSGEYLDPWDKEYIVFLDSDYDGCIRKSTGKEFIHGITDLPKKEFNGNQREYVNFSIVVWSTGPDRNSDSTASEKFNRDNVYSFPTTWKSGSGHLIVR